MGANSYRDDHVWSVENKTSRLLFASERDAYEYVRSFAASVGGGMVVSKLPVYRIASSSDATSSGT